MSDIDPILFTIRAAKAANQAAIEALTAVEQMLGERVLENASAQTKETKEPEGCQHKKSVEVSTGAGRFKICECGHQQEV
jgi:hypothetical protein